MNTPKFMHLLVFLSALSISLSTGMRKVFADEPQRPNIIFIMADDLGYRELGSYGQQKIRTPHLDKLATQGMRFTQFYSGAPVCAPARCVLMTGKHAGHAWIRDNNEHQPEGQGPIPASEETIAEMLKSVGYKTACVGKWGLGYPGSEGDPNKQGFDLFYGYNCQRHAHSYYPNYLWHNDKRVKLNNDPPIPGHARLARGADPNDPKSYEPFKGQDHASDRISAQALEFIRKNKDGPFFLYYASTIPHLALHVPDAELEQYLKRRWPETPFTGGRGYTPHLTPRAAYAAMISKLDTNVGRIMALLDELEIADNTVVMFTSDNGTTHLNREADAEFFNSVGELRGLKGTVYEGGIRVPLIVRWPGRVKAGSKTDHISAFYDVMPTLAEISGASMPDHTDGISYLPTITGRAGEQDEHDFLLWDFPGYGGQVAVRMGDWKAVKRNMQKNADAPIELYNLRDDIGENKNVAAGHPEIVSEIKDIIETQRVKPALKKFQFGTYETE